MKTFHLLKRKGHIYEKIIDLIRVGYHAFELLVFV